METNELLKAINVLRPIAEAFLLFANNYEKEQETEKGIKEKKETIEDKPITLEEARKILTSYTRSGYSENVKALVEKYGNGKLSAVKSENYGAMLKEAKYMCRAPLTKDEVSARIEELKSEGYSDKVSALFEHHNATGLEDLKSEYYASFMRDAEEIDHAGN